MRNSAERRGSETAAAGSRGGIPRADGGKAHIMTEIKLCGLTRAEDIEAANRLRPDYIGLVFAKKSKRYVTPEKAASLKALLAEGIKAVGVFVNEPPEQVAKLLTDGVIDIAQLHGAEDEDYIRTLRTLTDKPVIKAFRLGTAGTEPGSEAAAILTEAARCSADHILLDSGAGTGEAFDRTILKDFNRPFFLAGGMSPETVAEAIREVHPFAVDVSSGIETEGVKDAAKMQAFCDAVRKETL